MYETAEISKLADKVIEEFDKPKGTSINEKINAEIRRKQELVFGTKSKRNSIKNEY